MDEKEINQEYVELAGVAFDEALSVGNIEECRKIIAAVKEVDRDTAYALTFDLYNTPFPVSHPSSLLWM